MIWGLSKISQNMNRKPILDVYQIFSKLSLRFKRKFLQSLYTISRSYLGNGIEIVWVGSVKHSQKLPRSDQEIHFCIFANVSNTVLTIKTKIPIVVPHHIRVLQVRWYQNRTPAIKKQNLSSPKVTRRQPIVNFFNFFQKLSTKKIFYGLFTLY